jgi:hypothetical protein
MNYGGGQLRPSRYTKTDVDYRDGFAADPRAAWGRAEIPFYYWQRDAVGGPFTFS